MKISLLVNYDAPALLALNYLLPALSAHQLSVFYTDKNSKVDNDAEEISRLAELASFDRYLIDKAGLPISFDNSCCQKANKINTGDFSKLALGKPDLIVSIRHMTILRDNVIALPQHGVINLHSGQLPAYQGVMASFRAMQNRELELGTCLHFIEDSKIDTGSIIAQSTNRADYARSYLWNVLNIYHSGCANVLSAINLLAEGGTLNSHPQVGDSHYYSYPSESDLASVDFELYEPTDSISQFLSI